jgi:hypothetical protein
MNYVENWKENCPNMTISVREKAFVKKRPIEIVSKYSGPF